MKYSKHLNDEDVSSLMDNALARGEARNALAALLDSTEAEATWHRYHLIGDVVRSENLAPSTAELSFADRVMAALPNERPTPDQSVDGVALMPKPAAEHRSSAANASGFWLKALTGTLCIALVGLLVTGVTRWNTSEGAHADAISSATPAAIAPVTEVALEEDRPIMARDPELDALLSAHRQMGGHSALQAPAGFLRNATFERSGP